MIPGIVAQGVSGSPVITPAMLDPLNKGANVALSNLNLTATKASGGVGWQMARSTVGKSTGKFYLEATFDEFSGSFIGLGLGDAMASVSNFYGADNHGLIYVNNGAVFTGGALLTTIQTIAEGQVLGIAFDVDARLIWFRTNGGNWNDSGSADPATGVGGIAFNAGMTGTFYPGAGVQTSPSDQMTVNFGPTFAYTPPSGFEIVGEVGAPSILALGGITEDA